MLAEMNQTDPWQQLWLFSSVNLKTVVASFIYKYVSYYPSQLRIWLLFTIPLLKITRSEKN